MTAALADGRQIVPGYRLELCLGKGGFGEVWRAVGPGQVPVALKIIAAKGSRTGEREFQSLDLIRELRHPNLLPVQAYWLLDDDGQVIDNNRLPSTIVIAMMLGDQNLRQRLDQCRQGGIAGIPPRELLEHMRDAAKGIDYLNKPIHKLGDRVVAIQHRDIKPENLMLVGGGLMVADFGIAGAMESDHAHTTSAAMTCYYAAPELFDYTATAWTDQYALAITYAELRCGDLPFPRHSSQMQLFRIHTESRHDFSRLTPGEQAVLKRATAKVPEQRYPTCLAMIAELDAAVRAANVLDAVLPLNESGGESQVTTDLQGTQMERNVETVLTSNPPSPWGNQAQVTTQLQATDLDRCGDQSKVPTELQPTDLERPVDQSKVVTDLQATDLDRWGDQSKVVTDLQATDLDRWGDQSKVVTDLQATDLDRWGDQSKVVTDLQATDLDRWGDQSKVVTDLQPAHLNEREEKTSPGEPEGISPRTGTTVRGLTPSGPPRSRTPVWVGGAVAVIAVVGLIAWAIPRGSPEPRQPEVSNREPQTKVPPVLQTASDATPSTDNKPTLAVRLSAAREQAAAAAKENRYGDVVTALEPVFEQASATSEDYIMRGNSSLALADSDVSPAENYARAAADFEQAELPREQLRALTRQGRWLVDHNFAKQAVAPLRQALTLKKSADVQAMLCQALLATGDAKSAREEAVVALAEFPKVLLDDEALFAARLHHLVARACLALAKQVDADADLANRVEALDLEAEQHFQEAVTLVVALAKTRALVEPIEWQFELSAFRKLPRMVAREERRLRKERLAALTKSAEQNPEVAANWLELAELEQLDGQTKLAATHFGRGYSQQALALARAGKLSDAIKAEALATDYDADFAALYSARALIAAGQNRDREAVKLLDEALTRTPPKSSDRWQVLADRAAAYSRLAAATSGTSQDWEKSLSDYESAIASFPPTAKTDDKADAQQSLARLHFGRGRSLQNLKRTNEAIAAFNDAIAVQPKDVLALLARSYLIVEQPDSTAKQIEQVAQDIETALAAAATDEQTAEAHYVRSLVSLKTVLANVTQAATAEPALLKAQRDLLQAVKRMPTSTVYTQAATQLFDYAAKFAWSDTQRKTESETLQRDLKALRK